MKYEGFFLIAFVLLAMVLLILVVRSEKEHFGKYSANNTLAISQLGEDVNELNDRLGKVESKIGGHEAEQSKSAEQVDNAVTDIQIATS